MDKQKRLYSCKHFTGIQNKVCKVGVSYETVKDRNSYPFRWACMYDGTDIPCALREYRTIEEIEKEDEEFAVIFNNMMITRKAILEKTGGKRNVQGVIDCLICKDGKVGFSVAYNGHVHAQCTTDKCVSWIE